MPNSKPLFVLPAKSQHAILGVRKVKGIWKKNAYAVKSKNRTQTGPLFFFVLVCIGRVFDCVCAPK